MSNLARWIAEATDAALAKRSTGLPLNRCVRTVGPSPYGPLTRYVRGTCVVIGQLEVRL